MPRSANCLKALVCVVSVGQPDRPALERLAASLPEDTGLSVLSDLEPGDLAVPHVFWHTLNRPAAHPIHGGLDGRLKAEALELGFQVGTSRSVERYLYLDGGCYFADPSFRVDEIVALPGDDIVAPSLRGYLKDNEDFAYASQMRQFIARRGTPALRSALPQAQLPVGQAILINELTEATRAFPRHWRWVADLAQSEGMLGDPDAVDIGLALELCGARYAAAPDARWLRAIHLSVGETTRDLTESTVEATRPNAMLREQVATLMSVATGRARHDDLVPVLAAADWNGVLALAVAERVAPLVHRAVKSRPEVPAGVLGELREHYRQTGARVAQLGSILVDVLEALHHAGVPVTLLKGAALAGEVWTDIGLRPWSDLDLLVHRHQIAEAGAALESRGFRRARIETTAGATIAHENELMFEGTGGSIVDLHWSLFDSPHYQRRSDAAAIWHRTKPILFRGSQARVLIPEVQLLHLCGHLVLHHRGDELLWLNDIAELVACHRTQMDWNMVMAEAQSMGLVVALQRALSTAAATLAAPVPADVLERIRALQPSAIERAVVQRLGDQRRSMAARLWLDLTTMDSWSERLAFARTRLFPSTDYMRARYGIRHPALVALSYPYRWLIGVRRG